MRNKSLVILSVVCVLSLVFALKALNDSLSEDIFSSQPFLSAVSPGVNEALYFVSPSSGTFNVNDTFQVELRVGASTGITSIKAYLNFNSSLLSVTNISTLGSRFEHQWEPSPGNSGFDNTAGWIRLQRSTSTPYTGNGDNPSGLIATITFQAISAGTASLTYDAASLALKSDDTNILNIAGSQTASFSITSGGGTPPPPPPTPTPSPAPSGGGGGGGGGGTGGSVPVKGDCNNDKKVNVFDLSIMLSNWKKATTTCDLNWDGTINIFDFSILLSNWIQ